MTDQHDLDRDMQDLLTRYVSRQLNADDAARVEGLVQEDTAIAQEVAFLQKIGTAVKETPFPQSPGELGFKRLQQRIAAEEQAPVAANDNTMVDAKWRPFGIAASFVALVFSFLVFQQSLDPGSTDITVASGHTIVNGPVLQVEFQPEATEGEIRALLSEFSARIVDGPSALGLYRIELVDLAKDASEADVVLEAFRVRGAIVSSVELE